MGGEGFDDMNVLIKDAEDLNEEELVQLAGTFDADVTDSAEETSMRIT